MWWSWRKSKSVKGVRLTASKRGVSGSKRIGKRVTVSAGRRGARASFKIFGIRIGL
jgi:hypothetical protein